MQNLIRKSFTQVPNEIINDVEISAVARFLFVWLCSKPDDWKYYNSVILNALKIKSEDTLRKYFKELIVKGWVSKKQLMNPDGSFGTNELVLHPYPIFSGTEPSHKFSETEKNRDGKFMGHNNTNINTNTNLFSNTEDIALEKKMKNKKVESEDTPEAEILKYLNEQKGGRGFSFTSQNLSKIKALLKNKVPAEDLKKVIDSACVKWKKDEKMKSYIRPETLFGGKFDQYLVESEEVLRKKSNSGSDNFSLEEFDENNLI